MPSKAKTKTDADRTSWCYLKPVADLALSCLAFLTAYVVRYRLQWFFEVEPRYHVPFRVYIPSMLALGAILLATLWLEGAYRVERGRGLLNDLYLVFRSAIISIAIMIFIIFLATPTYYSRLIFGYTGILLLIFLGVSRAIEYALRLYRYRRGEGIHHVLIVGAGEMGRSVMRTIVARPNLGYRIVGFVDDDPERAQKEIGKFHGLGTTDDLPNILAEKWWIDEVIIALPWTAYRKILHVMNVCQKAHCKVRIVPDLFQITLDRVVVEHLDGVPLISVSEPTLQDWQRALKRLVDIFGAAIGLIVLSPLFLALAIAIKLDSPGPIIFKQTRVGRGRKEFTCYKFRSMYVDAEARLAALRERNEASGPLFKIKDDPRRTRVGQFLRRTSLDELPQLWNVLKGEMSLIGPRPAIPAEVEAYEPWHLRRLEVAPGITGLWQVSGRSDLTFDEMVLLDVYYIENWSPLLDLVILLRTIPTVLSGKGAY